MDRFQTSELDNFTQWRRLGNRYATSLTASHWAVCTRTCPQGAATFFFFFVFASIQAIQGGGKVAHEVGSHMHATSVEVVAILSNNEPLCVLKDINITPISIIWRSKVLQTEVSKVIFIPDVVVMRSLTENLFSKCVICNLSSSVVLFSILRSLPFLFLYCYPSCATLMWLK